MTAGQNVNKFLNNSNCPTKLHNLTKTSLELSYILPKIPIILPHVLHSQIISYIKCQILSLKIPSSPDVLTTNCNIWANLVSVMSQENNRTLPCMSHLSNNPKLQWRVSLGVTSSTTFPLGQPTTRAIRGVTSHLKRQDHLKGGNL